MMISDIRSASRNHFQPFVVVFAYLETRTTWQHIYSLKEAWIYTTPRLTISKKIVNFWITLGIISYRPDSHLLRNHSISEKMVIEQFEYRLWLWGNYGLCVHVCAKPNTSPLQDVLLGPVSDRLRALSLCWDDYCTYSYSPDKNFKILWGNVRVLWVKS